MTSLGEHFLSACRPGLHVVSDRAAELNPTLERLHALAAASWPGVDVAGARFVSFLAERVNPDDHDALASLRTVDLYLACGCTDRLPQALLSFERAMFPEIEGVLRRHRCDLPIDEFRQDLRHALFVPSTRAMPRIASYSGRGELRNWFRVMVLRQALNRVRDDRRRLDQPVEAEVLEAILPAVPSPELEPSRAAHAERFKQAFVAALDDLEPRQRLLLRYQLVDGFSLDDLARLLGVHRSTVARWLRRTKDDLLERTKVRLAEAIGGSTAEAASVIRWVLSQLDVTLSRVL